MDGLAFCGVISTAIALVDEDNTATEGIFLQKVSFCFFEFSIL
ncbi:hypothetical protein LEP1GSC083_3742 [Leptospira interrogans serovar Pyrogenes str. L0374]|uniref:Uncharacterized protein n=3 Tax=Leptospira interrogans TaxID=173 RepID=A0A829DAG5_LEPIR|nr:hypothetical protein LEP1GSC007_4071 [Leptospira interrogans serovar Bulgarica str. Mallika]EKO06372.1 hypothetical protein LEP1GSC077_2375 [Leptospira interrogans str. C10069]EMN31152.1 hypothetical protein LEP1GSC083_3742 [Leptospira interrogans serovar Pyrogenes str. L0374]EMN62578.1 hypothetical protein LEP1GSC092_4553 [Leptospira interrogans serovar Pyrogenes str. R168]EMY05411.1 hypothetical protein LEP1GSC029_2337 [Leptospira interrogans str. 2002000626]EMY24950.1 hypothetical protei